VYHLIETNPAPGFDPLTAPIVVTITHTGGAATVPPTDPTGAHTVEFAYAGSGGNITLTPGVPGNPDATPPTLPKPPIINVRNDAGGRFADTGGTGTQIFGLIGLTMMSGAGIGVIARKRLKKSGRP
jgi:LPXTG-motif cell wall-anchored protein